MTNNPRLETRLELGLESNPKFLNLAQSQYLSKFRTKFPGLEKCPPGLENGKSLNPLEVNKYKALAKFRKIQKIVQKKSSLEPP